jgi:hypothetical protein
LRPSHSWGLILIEVDMYAVFRFSVNRTLRTDSPCALTRRVSRYSLVVIIFMLFFVCKQLANISSIFVKFRLISSIETIKLMLMFNRLMLKYTHLARTQRYLWCKFSMISKLLIINLFLMLLFEIANILQTWGHFKHLLRIFFWPSLRPTRK